VFFLSYLRAQQVYLIERLEHSVAAALKRDKIERKYRVSFLSYLRAQQVYLIEHLEHSVAAALKRDKIKREEIQGVLFIISPSTAGLSHRTPGTSCSSCLKQG